MFAFLLLLGAVVEAAFISFDNCLSSSLLNSSPQRLQWVPLYVDARFDAKHTHNLSLTFYGNVTGRQLETPLPPPSDTSYWNNPNQTNGKIANEGMGNQYLSTLLARYMFLSYDAYNAPPNTFCGHVLNGSGPCPVAPVFDGDQDDPYSLRAFSTSHQFSSSYAFGTLQSTVRVIAGDVDATEVACISANVTPTLGSAISGLLTWLPAAILILKGIATLAAAIYSPWGSSDIFRWSSNYGRDEDLLRLVTPGFGDCLQYIQFVVLTGSLSLQYPGYFQPAVSQASWSLLLFNESFVSTGTRTHGLVDGVYATNGTYGMERMSQLVGMAEVDDVWAVMAVWLLVIAVIVIFLCQLGFAGRWIYRRVTDTSEEDLRSKNLPFTLGNMIRLMFNYFILPIVALSLFQLVIAPRSPTSVVACSVILLVIMILAAAWILRVIFTTKPRTYLFDDMPTVLLYGPLYNTYSDSAAPFALVPVFITFMRGVAIGAVQPSGIAQIILLAICEVILILTLNAFRPFQGQTSMNAYHTFFAVVRLITVLLSISFVPSLGVTEASKGWIGYAVLLLHACVLVFGFFLNAAQTLIEVIARNLGVGTDGQHGATRGSILNWRMLKKRENRASVAGQRNGLGDRGSMTSHAAMLQDGDGRSGYAGTRSRSLSASSQQLLNRMSGMENLSNDGGVPSASADEGASNNPNSANQKPVLNVNTGEATTETYYRPPRQRTRTMDALTPGAKSRDSGTGEIPYTDSPSATGTGRRDHAEIGGSLNPGRDSPAPAFFRDRADSSDHVPVRTDYAVREVDQYYRGQALSDLPRRSLKTGPADPEGPAVAAQSWLQKLAFGLGIAGAPKGGKDKHKGFEVVRSAPARWPAEDGAGQYGPHQDVELVTSPGMRQEPYRDSPELRQGELQATAGAARSITPDTSGAPRSMSPVSPIQRTDAPVIPPVQQSHPMQPFEFGIDSVSDPYAGRQSATLVDTGRQNNRGGSFDNPARSAPQHPGLRAEGGSLRSDLPALTPRRGLSVKTTNTTASSMYDDPNHPNRASSYYGERDDDDDAHSFGRVHPSDIPSLGPIQSVGAFDLPSRFNSRRSQAGMSDHRASDPDIGHTAGGQAWLRQIDELDRSHDNPRHSADTPFERAAPVAASSSSPPVPARSSRRTPSNDITPASVRYAQHQQSQLHPQAQAQSQHAFTGFDSVSHHRAADSISRNSLGAEAGLQEQVAQVAWRESDDDAR